ncbi:MAG: hypothetical protein AAB727_03005 [Patescibacteria group bacterium]
MDKISKALRALTQKERDAVRSILTKLAQNDTSALDIKKLRGHDDIFRVRKGHLRIIYRVKGNAIFLIAIEKRREDTYKF